MRDAGEIAIAKIWNEVAFNTLNVIFVHALAIANAQVLTHFIYTGLGNVSVAFGNGGQSRSFPKPCLIKHIAGNTLGIFKLRHFGGEANPLATPQHENIQPEPHLPHLATLDAI